MSKKVTLERIAAECGVTKGLVSRALAGKYNVSDETRDLIYKKAVQLGYDFSKLKASKKTLSRILLVCPSRILFKEDFWQPIINEISSTLNRHSIALEYFVYDEETLGDEQIANITKSIYGGYIVMHVDPTPLMDRILEANKPVVLVDPKRFSDKATQIKFSNYDSFYSATEYLIHKGHRSILFYGAPDHSTSFRERYEGFMAAIASHKNDGVIGIEACFDNSHNTYDDPAVLKEALEQRPTALLCANDIIAINAMTHLRRLGLNVPEDVSVIGFDNVQEGLKCNPPLTTFNIPRAETGRQIAAYLISAMTTKESIFSQIVIRCPLIERESVSNI